MQKSKKTSLLLLIPVLICLSLTDLYAYEVLAPRDTTKAHRHYSEGMEKLKESNFYEAMDLFDDASRLYGRKKMWDRVIECNLRKTDAWTSIPEKTGLIEFWKETVVLSEDKFGRNHATTGDCYNRFGELYYFDNDTKLAREWFDKAMAVYSGITKEPSLSKAKVYTNYGRLMTAISEYDSVEQYLDRALEIQLSFLDSLDRRLSTTYHSYATFYYYVGKMDQAIHYNKLVLEIDKRKYGEIHPKVANGYNNIGAAYERKGDFESSLVAHEKALEIRLAKLDSLHPHVALSYNNLGNVYTSLGDYNTSDEYHNIALRLRKQVFDEDHINIGMSYANIGNNQLKQGHYDLALEYFKKVVPIAEKHFGPGHMQASEAIQNVGIPYYYMGRLDSAFHYLYRALIIREGVQGGINGLVAGSYNNIGAIYKENHDYDLALTYYFKSLEVKRILAGEDGYALSGSYNNIGEVYYLTKDFEQALEYYLKALEIDIKHLGPENPKLAGRFLNLGSVLADMGRFEESFEYNKKALELQVGAYGKKNRLVCSIYTNMAMNYKDLDSLESALEFMELALRLREEISEMKDPQLTYAYTRFGMLLAENGRTGEGLAYLHRGLAVNYFGEIDPADLNAINPARIKDGHGFIETLAAMTEFNNEYLDAPERKDLYLNNLPLYELIASLSIKLREAYRFEQSKLFALKQWDYLYSEAFETAAGLYEITGKAQYFERAFRFAGLKKNSALMDAILTSQALKNSGIPDSIIVREESLNADLESLRQSLLEIDDSTGTDSRAIEINSQLNSTVIELNHLFLNIEEEYPDYNNLRSHYPDYSLEEISGMLDEEALILDFVVTDSAIYSMVIGKHVKQIVRIDVPDAFENSIRELLASVKKYRIEDFKSLSYEVYGSLIRPVENYLKGIKKLIIIPESYLLLLPFDILICGEEAMDQSGLTELDYLVKSFEIVSHYSTDLWVRSYKKSNFEGRNPEAEGFLGFAPVFDKGPYLHSIDSAGPDTVFADRAVVDRLSLQELPFSFQEIDQLQSLFSEYGQKTSAAIRSDATEDHFRKESPNYKYIHIATHGLINPEKPELSGLVFWSDRDSSEATPELLISARNDDGVLYTKEVYALKLNANLVTLSACETGAGKLVRGEGILSFVRGFTYAGIPNVLITCWKVNDKTTADFMLDFYRGVLAGDSYPKALRKAKLKAISDPSTAFPATWGTFVLIGN